MKPSPTDVSCHHCGNSVPLLIAVATDGYCMSCAANNPEPATPAGCQPETHPSPMPAPERHRGRFDRQEWEHLTAENALIVTDAPITEAIRPEHVRELIRLSQVAGCSFSATLNRAVALFVTVTAPRPVASARRSRRHGT